MTGLNLISFLIRIANGIAGPLFAISYFGILWAVYRSARKYRETGWQMGIGYAVLCLTIPAWVVGLAWLFEALSLTSPLPKDFVP